MSVCCVVGLTWIHSHNTQNNTEVQKKCVNYKSCRNYVIGLKLYLNDDSEWAMLFYSTVLNFADKYFVVLQ